MRETQETMKKIENSNLTDAVYARIKSMILDGLLVPGSRINKKDLANALEVSQTPVNEAISRLAGEKLIEQKSRAGFFVRSYDDRELADLYAVRAGLEGIAARLCATEASESDLQRLSNFFISFGLPISPTLTRVYMEEDIAFHKAVLAISGIPLLSEINENFHYTIKSYEHGLMRPPSETLHEHRAIIDALRKRDSVHAGELMIAHHIASRKALIARNPVESR